jgi:hypothetical protein
MDCGSQDRMSQRPATGRQRNEAGRLGRREIFDGSAEAIERSRDGCGIAGLAGGGHEERALRWPRHRPDTPEECVLDPAADSHELRDRLAATQFGLGQRGRQLRQRERIPASEFDDLIGNTGRQIRGSASEQEARLGAAEPAQIELREPGRAERPRFARPCTEEQDDALGLEPSRGEEERLC